MKKILQISVPLFFVALMPQLAWAQGGSEQPLARPIVILLALAALAILPFIVMMGTSFVKIAVVLALVRNALGTQQIPPNPIVTGLAMLLSIYIMMPVGEQMYKEIGGIIQQQRRAPALSEASVNMMVEALNKGKEPFRDFLLKNTHDSERKLFYDLARELRDPEHRGSVGDKDFQVIIPGFVISELTEAFQIGFIIFLPFLVVDMVVTNILLALGMFQISPITISLPFKLLLFVLADGWHLIAKALIQGYL